MGSLESIRAQLDELLAAFVTRHHLPGAAAGVVVGGELEWAAGAGLAEVETGRLADERTLYAIASISKTFTATAVLQLRDEGRLGLDDPLVLHVPEFSAATNPFGAIEMVTLRHLLQHTSGLQSEVPASPDLRTTTLRTRVELLAALGDVRVLIPPGTAFKYSNLGFRMLGEVVRRVSGLRLHEWVRSQILEPLEMRSTTDRPVAELVDRQARGYVPDGDGKSVPARAIDPAWCEGDGDLWSSVEDLGRWVAQQLRTDVGLERRPGQVLAGRTIAEMHRPTFVADRELTGAQGLGWYRWRHGDAVLAGHSGWIYGFTSHVCFDPARRIGAIVLVNGICPERVEFAASLFDCAASRVASSAALSSRVGAPSPPVPPEWAGLLGTYWHEEGTEVRIEWRDGRLVCVTMPLEELSSLLAAVDPLRFLLTGEDRVQGEELRFFDDRTGRIEGLNLSGYAFFRSERPA